MSSDSLPSIRDRADAVRDRLDIVQVISPVVKLGRGRQPRGKCPFHGSKSDSFAVYPDTGRARCWGCGWSGDAIAFVRDHYGLTFIEALERLEADAGLDGLAPAPVRRAKIERPRGGGDRTISSSEMARVLWKAGLADLEGLRIYLVGRGIPRALLEDHRLADFRLHKAAPLYAWDAERGPAGVPTAPAMLVRIRRPNDWAPIGIHVTYFTDDLSEKLDRRRRDGSMFAPRKMLGRAMGGAVVLPGIGSKPKLIGAAAPLFVGEGIETVLSGMALSNAPPEACGLAVLSLDNLQGKARRTPKGALPLYAIAPDRERTPALAFAHDGPVTGLIDADMKPLRGPIDRRSGQPRGLPVIERRGWPIVRRTIGTAERAEICAQLFVRSWRSAGCPQVEAVRPHLGQDFNDAVRDGEFGGRAA